MSVIVIAAQDLSSPRDTSRLRDSVDMQIICIRSTARSIREQ